MSLTIRSPRWPLVVTLLLIAGLTEPRGALADDPPPGWSGKGQAGFVQSRGNSDADTANAALDVFLVRADWSHNLTLDGLYGRSAGVTSAQRWDVRLQSSYQFTQHLFTFAALSYQDDLFSGFQYQASASGGIGYKFINTAATRLNAQVGAGYRSLRPELLIKDADGAVVERIPEATQSDVVATAGATFEHAFNSSTKLTDKLLVESGANNTSVRNDLALEVKMAGRLSLAAGYSVIENTSPPDNLKKVDTTTTLNLVYSFGQPAGKAAAAP